MFLIPKKDYEEETPKSNGSFIKTLQDALGIKKLKEDDASIE
jgi:hypothetical protein